MKRIPPFRNRRDVFYLVHEEPTKESKNGIYIVKPKDNSYRAIWAVVWDVPLKLMSTSDGYTKEEVDKIISTIKDYQKENDKLLENIKLEISKLNSEKADRTELANVVAGLVPMGSAPNLAELETKPKRSNDAYYVEDQLSPEGNAYIYRWDAGLNLWVNTKQVVFKDVITQGLGDSSNKAMSQKAVTDVVSVLNNSIKQLNDIYKTDSYYSAYNHKYDTDGIRSVTKLQKSYLIQAVGDYFEIEARYWGNSSGYDDKLALITTMLGDDSRFGWYGINEIWFRVAGEDFKIWNVSSLNLNWNEFHKYKLLVVNGGYELFIDGISCGTVENNLVEGTNYRIQYIASAIILSTTPQKYDVRGIKIHSASDGDEDIRPTAQYVGSTNVELALKPKELDTMNEQIQENTNSINLNSNAIKQLDDIYKTDSYYSAYNHKYDTDGIRSVTLLDKNYTINAVGDYFEIEAKYWGDSDGYADKLSLVSGTDIKSRFGWYSLSSFQFRVSEEAYKIWDLSSLNIIPQSWHKFKLIRVETGWELFVDGVSCGIQANNLAEGVVYKLYSLSSAIILSGFVQKYDIRYFSVHSSVDGDTIIQPLAFYGGSTNVDLLVYAPEVEESENNPLCFVSYNSVTKYFDIYLRDKQHQNIYYGFKVYLANTRGTIHDPIHYQYFWELTNNGYIYKYDKSIGVMTSTGAITIATGESECVFMYTDVNGSKADFTGGIHGDESIDVVEGNFAHFYIDGVMLTESELSNSFSMFACKEFSYIQKSSMHQTAYRVENKDTGISATGAGALTVDTVNNTFTIDGINTNIPAYNRNSCYRSTAEMQADGVTLSKSVSNTWVISFVRQIYPDHPVIATHLKQTIFKEQKYTTENVLIFNNSQTVSLWYHGICCLGKGVALIGHNENFEDHTFIGERESTVLQAVGLRMFEAYNPNTLGSGLVKSWITDGGGVLNDSEADMFIVDRASDSKYYRTIRDFVPPVNKRLVSFMEVEFNFKDGSTV